MDIYHVRNELKTKPIRDIELRVTFYARVSSEKDEQLNSLNNQTRYYEEYIRSNPKWVYVEGYVDEGISGISTEKRENFHRMVDDALSGKFDYIVTKEISRFARNTLDSIGYTRKLLSNGVAVFFQNDNINTLDEDSEFRLTIMAGVAQDGDPQTIQPCEVRTQASDQKRCCFRQFSSLRIRQRKRSPNDQRRRSGDGAADF